MYFEIIWLNGASSSGKTTLSKELQTLLDDQFMHVCFDAFYQKLPARFKPSTPADSKYVERVHLGFEYSIPALAKAGKCLIVDYPFHYLDSLPRCLELVSEYRVLYVGVFCPVDVLEQREGARGDRKVGLARKQTAIVHLNSEYDRRDSATRIRARPQRRPFTERHALPLGTATSRTARRFDSAAQTRKPELAPLF